MVPEAAEEGRPLVAGAAPRGLWRLYLSHFLSTFGDRMFQFAVPVLFMKIWVDSLFPGALFSFGVNLAAMFIVPACGPWIDRTPRLHAMAVCVFGEAAAMVTAAVFFIVMLRAVPDTGAGGWIAPTWTPQVVMLYAVIVFFSCLTELALQVGTICLESDWPACLAPKCIDPESGKLKADKRVLTSINSQMSSIDQSCKLLAPFAYGVLVQFIGGGATKSQVVIGVGVIAAWNVLCVPLEFFTLRSLYAENPSLAEKEVDEGKSKGGKNPLMQLLQGWQVWSCHELMPASLAAAMLNFTVLSAGAVTTGWLVWAGIPLGPLGFLRGVGAVIGIVGSQTNDALFRACGKSPLRTACAGVGTFCVLLLPCSAAITVFGATPAGAWALLASITVSRFALFWFKPNYKTLTQDHLAKDIRGRFMGVDKALANMFLAATALMAMLLPRPAEFATLVYVSNASVAVATLIFFGWSAARWPPRAAGDA